MGVQHATGRENHAERLGVFAAKRLCRVAALGSLYVPT
jgi:hypothetical protein